MVGGITIIIIIIISCYYYYYYALFKKMLSAIQISPTSLQSNF